ncbi:restriction endonuclease subunit S [Helicobacter pylori]|uniref:restriction endonuclease subunit S n=1 Tax=Helicobacter pylori TaxID=210 RepID=UPI0009A2EE1C|nr:restriction endonuclease subunit S [Helicobacter pylori]NHA72966.1 restriction endonuclease subunit S [Helicobacter pylori]OPG20472.1 type I restriction endonuclease subunit S [Helicobacter pylori]QEF33643.1 restriction endonuclease subunit S [Helicobacter pylori]
MDALTTPSNWQRVRLGDVAHIFDGTHQTPQYTHYGVAFFSVENIVSDKPSKFISQQDYLTATNQNRPEYNDILLTRIGTIGVSKVVNWNYPFSIYVTLAVIKQSKYFNSYYLHYFIQSNFFQKELKNNSLLQAIPCKINMNELKKCEVILPPLNEQIAIANILSDVDRYLYSLDALILKKESVKKALSFELLSQRKRLKGFNQNWQRVRLGDICEIVKGQQINKISLNNTDKYPVINGGIDFLGYTNKFNVSKNTIAISEGGTCGYVRFMTSDFWSGGHNYSLQKISNKVNNLCLYHILKSYEKDIMKLGVGSGLKNIQLKALKDFEILLPPLDEQIAIANILSDVDSEIISLKNKKRQFENIKKALNHDLMSAKIRVLKK